MLINGTPGPDSPLPGTPEDDEIYGFGGTDYIYGGDGNDLIFGGENDAFDGGTYEWLIGGNGNDTIYGGGGEDWIWDVDGDDQVYGESGDDVVSAGFGGRDSYDGGSGADILIYNDTQYGDEGIDLTLDLSKGRLTGGDHNDSISGFEAVVLKGAGSHTVIGSKDGEILQTGSGDDSLRGYKGADVMSSGTGYDTFQWERRDVDAVDVIEDFDVDYDTLDFSGLVKGVKFDTLAEIVRLEHASVESSILGEAQQYTGTMVSVYTGNGHGWQDVVVLAGLEDATLDQLADAMFLT